MHTSVGFFAFAGLLTAFAGPVSAQDLAWKNSYLEARDHGQKVKKPLAVFVGAGAAGFQQIVQDGAFSSDIRKILAAEYTLVYLDADRADHKRLIGELGISSRKGLVLSDRAGDTQAFFHDGTLSEAELTSQLRHYADPALIVRSTSTTSSGRYSFYPPNGSYSSGTSASPSRSTRNC
ncbi:MAG: hypothetical protein EXR98_05140 [Gemmataceae bacterium]|nr:hypothetical protein [Gemmataceae bacterium]